MEIKKQTLQKLRNIEWHQNEVKRLVEEIEHEYGLEGVTDAQPWTFGMNIDSQGSVCTAKESEKILQEFLILKEEEQKVNKDE